ncbi:DUF7551 domain-containing protein [Halopiger goleimassiliensis]|uniref:DUF7551 domain-containing protein n=1 Tax=Halopiger goleimassiliensis TaxID=1293048 RepID=UPI0006775DF7|nr:hypothetical protein [Halopiger goleimassiliensis]
MVGATLDDIRRYVESIASDSGDYVLVCGRTGERPVPAAGLTFDTRPTARAAARATEQYRAALRRYDPQVPYYDVVVCQRSAAGRDSDPERRRSSETEDPLDDRASMIDFCHTVAGAVFESVAASSYTDVEDAIMDTYFSVAESVDGPDELCIRLIESMATELEDSLDPDEQREILLASANRLPPGPADEEPLESALSRLQAATVLEAFTLDPDSDDADETAGSWTVTLDEYAFGDSDERLVTLPIVLDVLRRRPDRELEISAVERLSEESATWRLDVSTEATSSNGLIHASPEPEP